jgi:hypothetical protein
MVNLEARKKYSDSLKLDKKIEEMVGSIVGNLKTVPDDTKSEDFSIGMVKHILKRIDVMILLLMSINKQFKKTRK